ncbi:ATP-binding cassette domain-containing protein [Streptomyces sp. NPDC005438]|uniref:ATP-binding cassette domain-containing protein n=1 Tax=Streptomyces sp. NPDC005438 TaxID=3156880 RepID=UPI0033BD5A36
MHPTPAILIEDLYRTYRTTHALNGLHLTVPHGAVHGLLGPNGAGKTTAVRILTTLLRPTRGRALVAGHDVVREPTQVRRRIGLLGQHAAVDEELSGWQNLEMFGRLHHLGRRDAARRATALLERFALADTGHQPVSQYSGGMRRRLDLAASLLGGDDRTPEVLFLDEPTTGLDPRGRAEVWKAVRSLVHQGTTVLLTTQYLEEADQLADHIAVLAHGRVAAEGTPDQLKSRLGADRIEVVLRDASRLDEAAPLIARAADAPTETDPDRRTVSAPTTDRIATLSRALRALEDAHLTVEDISVRRPTLDEVFLHLTDHPSTTAPTPDGTEATV